MLTAGKINTNLRNTLRFRNTLEAVTRDMRYKRHK